jgi:hypothetical protein
MPARRTSAAAAGSPAARRQLLPKVKASERLLPLCQEGACAECDTLRSFKDGQVGINQSTNVTSVAMRFDEEFMPAMQGICVFSSQNRFHVLCDVLLMLLIEHHCLPRATQQLFWTVIPATIASAYWGWIAREKFCVSDRQQQYCMILCPWLMTI